MTPKRGQPPKPPGERRTIYKNLAYNQTEMALLEEAYRLSGEPNTIARWLAEITLEEARQIIESHQK